MPVPLSRHRACVLAAGTTAAGLALGLVVAPPAAAVDTSSAVIINEVYGGGGNSGATYKRDFIELINTGTSAVDLSSWSVWYASATGTTWQRTALTGSINPGSTYLIAEAAGSGGTTDLPTADASGTIGMSGTSGKVALTNSSTTPTGSTGSNVVDFVGYGTVNDAAGGSANAAPANSGAVSAQRTNSPSVVNTGNNKADFFAAAATPKAANTDATTPPPTGGGGTPGPDTIQDVQGSGFRSPKAGQSVSNVPGIVTAVRSTGSAKAFWIQQPTRDAAKPSASSGVQVFTGSTTPTVAVGDSVLVSGTVTEFVPGGAGTSSPTGNLSVTEITSPSVSVVAQSQPLPSALVLDASDIPSTYAATPVSGNDIESITTVNPAASVQEFYEAHEGEVVAVNDARAVSRKTDFNEVFVTAKPNEQATPRGGTYLPSYAATPTGRIKIEPIATTLPAYNVGDVVAGTTAGPLDWDNFGGYLIAATQVGNRTDNDLQPTVATKAASGEVSVATYNVENLDPNDPADKFTRLAQGIVTNLASPDIVTLEEIQDNNGATDNGVVDAGQTLQQLADAVVAAGGPRYSFLDIDPVNDQDGGEPGGNIRVGFFYNPDRVGFTGTAPAGDPSTTATTVSTASDGTAVLSANPGRIDPANDAFTNSRKPLVAQFTFDGKKVFVVANHFNSKGGDQNADGKFQPPTRSSEVQRTKQATVLNGFVKQLKAADPDANVVLAGDFNDYQFSGPMTTLTDNGATLTDLINTLPANERYTYVFNGVSQVLDHIFVSNNLTSNSQYEVVHLNAEFADQASDHDPQVVRIKPVATNPNTTVQLLNINDFHGRIDSNTVKWAGTIEQQRALVGDANSVLLSAGDNIGASLFASASQQDNPTIDVLNAIGLSASAVGNHEFDQGFSDLTDRVIPRAKFTYLGANVTYTDTGAPALPQYAIVEVGGLKVGVIGAVTQETPTLVSPAGVANLTFGDPVAAVNRVADQLTDGDASNGEADVLVAEYHEGAPDNETDSTPIETEIGKSAVFDSIVNDTTAKVGAIFTGHTHRVYTYDGPVPGQSGKTRPIMQTGEYGNNIGNITLTVNKSTKQVAAYSQNVVARTTVADSTLVSSYPRVAQVKQITDAALAQAAVIGQQPVGSVTADITRAYTTGSNGSLSEDRGSESTIGDTVANMLRAELSDPGRGNADIGVVNPGGLRNDLSYADTFDTNGTSTGGGPGVVTYSEANAVLPFGNRLYTLSLTGAQFKQVLEQQWQPASSSRPFLNLGLSSNVSVTYDPAAAAGSRITSVQVNGLPLDPAGTYRIGTFSFLADGGDNFTAFTGATDVKDTAIIDRDAWIHYLNVRPNLSPSFAKRAVVVTNQPTAGAAGATLPTFAVSKLDLTSKGAPANTTLAASMNGVSLGTFPVSGGAASVSVTLPSTVSGPQTLVLTAAPSGTVVRIPLTVTPAGTATVKGPLRVAQGDVLTTNLAGWKAGEQVKVALGSVASQTVTVSATGTAVSRIRLGVATPTGQYPLTATSVSSGATSAATTVTVLPKPFQAGRLVADQSIVEQGGTVRLDLSFWSPRISAKISIDDRLGRLATARTNAAGAGSVEVTVPLVTTPGVHRLVATAPDGSLVSVNIKVVEPQR